MKCSVITKKRIQISKLCIAFLVVGIQIWVYILHTDIQEKYTFKLGTSLVCSLKEKEGTYSAEG